MLIGVWICRNIGNIALVLFYFYCWKEKCKPSVCFTFIPNQIWIETSVKLDVHNRMGLSLMQFPLSLPAFAAGHWGTLEGGLSCPEALRATASERPRPGAGPSTLTQRRGEGIASPDCREPGKSLAHDLVAVSGVAMSFGRSPGWQQGELLIPAQVVTGTHNHDYWTGKSCVRAVASVVPVLCLQYALITCWEP